MNLKDLESEFEKEFERMYQNPDNQCQEFCRFLRNAVRKAYLAGLDAVDVEGMRKGSAYGAPFCRNCRYAMVKSTGMGKIVFNWQCPNCNSYQEDFDEKTNGYNSALDDLSTLKSEIKKKNI